MSTFETGNHIVDELGQFELDGIIIPESWYRGIRTNGGRPHYLAILILGDIVSGYRPKLVKEEITGKIIGCYKQFSGELLQKSYDTYAEMYGVDKETVKRAIVTLEQLGIVRRIFRTVNEQNGIVRNNVLLLDLNVKALYVMTFRQMVQGESEEIEFVQKEKDTKDGAVDGLYTEVNTPMVRYDHREDDVEASNGVKIEQTTKARGRVKNEQRWRNAATVMRKFNK